jgi:hypothetical protein
VISTDDLTYRNDFERDVMTSLKVVALLGRFNKPQYLVQPKAVLRRLFGIPRTPPGKQVVHLRWGLPLEVDPSESIGREIRICGIFEIPVLETIFRLTYCTDTVLDAFPGSIVGT